MEKNKDHKSTIRCFIAINLPRELKEHIHASIKDIKAIGHGIKWVDKENLHITVKFLGDVNTANIERISNTLADVAGKTAAFELRIDHFGVFPSERKPRVLWVGCENEEPYIRLAGSVDEALSRLGFEMEKKKPTAHVTIARCKFPKEATDVVQRLSSKSFQPINLFVDSVQLMRSTLTPKGAIYEIISSYKLKA